MLQPLGRRIAAHRAKLGWTQQQLAERVAISRVALSHIEAGTTVPGERTVVLLAGVFKVEPHELVAGTSYPQAKTERLPELAARYTEVELQLEILSRDLQWVERTGAGWSRRVADEWEARLHSLLADARDPGEAGDLRRALGRLRSARSLGAG